MRPSSNTKLKILLANPRGFCAGVNMAIDCVNQVLELKGPPIYVFHEIVHNKHVVEDFQERGVVFVDHIGQVPSGAVVIYSAHGISPAIRDESKDRNLVEIDATCPLVTKVHFEVLRFAKEGYKIIFIGHRNHDEAIGTMGEAPDSMVIVESVEEVEALTFTPDEKLAYVTQTTLSIYDANKIVDALKRKYPGIRQPPKEDICYATTNRQNVVTALAPEVDLVLVIGSKNSSNSKRLVETAESMGVSGYLIDQASEIDPQWLAGKRSVLVTAGASAPEHLVQGLLDRLQSQFGGVIETRTLTDEDVSFAPPKSLRSLAVIG